MSLTDAMAADEFTPRVSFDYAFSDDNMVYASWSRGFRSGGFNGRGAVRVSRSSIH